MMMAIVGKLGGTVSSASLLGHLLPRQAERRKAQRRGRGGRRKARKGKEGGSGKKEGEKDHRESRGAVWGKGVRTENNR